MAEGRNQRSLRSFLELFALNGFVVVQPLLDVMGRSPELFVLRRASRLDIVLLALGLVLVPPVVLWGIERVVRRAVLHRLFVTALLVLLAVQVLKDVTSLRNSPLAAVAVAFGVASGVAVSRVESLRTWLRYLAAAPIAFALLFLVVSPASKLVIRPEAAGAAGVVVGEDGPPIVMLVFDEFPLMSLLDEGRVDADLFPSFARLAAESTWFRNTTAVNGYTSQAVPAMLTGRFPAGRAPVAVENPSNLFTLLGGAYDVTAYEAVTSLCPPSICEQGEAIGPTGLDALVTDAADAWNEIMDLGDEEDDVTESILEGSDGDRAQRREAAVKAAGQAVKANQPARFNRFVEQLGTGRRQSFSFLHLLLPHTPWRYLPSGMQYEHRPFGKDGDLWIDEPWITTHHRQRHLLQLAYTDRLLGQVLDRLDEQGIYDDALVIVTSDHGAGFVAGSNFRKLEDDNIAQLAWVPLFVKVPGQRTGDIRDHNVMTVDVLPTVADVLDIDLPWAIDGVSAFGPPRTSAQKLFMSAGTKVIDGDRWLPEVLRGSTAALGIDPGGPDDLFRLGPHPQLLGTPVPTDEDAAVVGRATVADLDAFLDVRRSTGFVPALVTGAVDGIAPPDAVAIALNGTIVATSGLYGSGPPRFAAVVPDAAFVDGVNRLDVLAVGSDGTVTPMRVRG